MSFLPPITGNGKHTTFKNGDDWGMGNYCFAYINDDNSQTDSDYINITDELYAMLLLQNDAIAS